MKKHADIVLVCVRKRERANVCARACMIEEYGRSLTSDNERETELSISLT